MRRLVFTLAALAAICHVSTARADDPGVSWYGANSSWNGGDIGVSYFEYESAEGNPNEMAFGIAEDGSFSGVAWQAFNDVFSGDPQMTMAITALEKSLQAQVMARNIAVGLDNLAVVATDWQGNTVSVKVQRSDAIGTGGKPAQTVSSLALPAADNVTLTKAANGKLSLAGWDYGAKGPLFLANLGGSLSYLPLADGGGGCGCTNAWASLAGWIGDGTAVGTNGLDFANTALAGAVAAKGFHNAVDGKTLESAYDKDAGTNTVGIKGFADGAACGASLTAMLAATNSVDAAGHLLLTRHSSGELHYLPLGAAEFDRLGPTLKFVGTDPENVAVVPGSSETNTVTFASAWDSNVKVTVERDGANGVKVTFGVYYK